MNNHRGSKMREHTLFRHNNFSTAIFFTGSANHLQLPGNFSDCIFYCDRCPGSSNCHNIMSTTMPDSRKGVVFCK